jgi:choline dehydrogenase-like flavoprotein
MYLNIEAKKLNTYDAIVVGSGISGGYAAKELTEKGLQVLMLERGKPFDHVTGYEAAMKNPWEIEHHNTLTVQDKIDNPYLTRDAFFDEATKHQWMKDSDAPYEEKKPFDWYRPNIVGGKSIMWGRQSYRWSDIDFEANAKEGIAVDWPIRYKDIEPWYNYVEKFVGISGQALGLPQLPDSIFQPPMPMNCAEKHVAAGIKNKYGNSRVMTIGRVAMLTAPTKFQTDVGRTNCQFRNLCRRGCPFGGYFSTQSATLPAAMKTKRLTLRPNSMVMSLIYDDKLGKATGVRVVDAVTMQETEYYAKIIFVNASTLGTTQLLLNSTSSRFPNGFGNDSGALGKYFMDHHFRVGANGTLEGFDDQYVFGRRANGIYIPRYRNIGTDKRDYLRGFGYQGSGARGSSWQQGVAEAGFGADFKESLTQPAQHWSMGIMGFGECLPYESNTVSLDQTKKDKWGMPKMVFDCEFKENERKMQVDMRNDAAEMLEAAGVKNIKTNNQNTRPGMAIHEMGTARMGKDPKTSVLNKWNQVHAAKNVFVTDGACMTSSSCVNPSLTYMALTARAVDFVVKEMKKGGV